MDGDKNLIKPRKDRGQAWRFSVLVHSSTKADAFTDEMDPGIQLVEYARIALDNIHAEIVDVIQFRCIDKYVEAVAAVFFQEVQEFRG